MIVRMLLAAVALALAGAATALDLQGVHLADKAGLAGHEVVLNGAGVRTKVVFKVYVGSLWLPNRARDLGGVLAQSPRRIQMNLLRNLSADQLSDALLDGLKANLGDAELAAIKGETDRMLATLRAFGDAREGSVVTLDFVDGATHIARDGEERAAIPGAAFNAALTRIWLGDHPVQDDLKRAMLGGG